MAREHIPIEISNVPDLQRIAEAVRATGRPHALKQGEETVAGSESTSYLEELQTGLTRYGLTVRARGSRTQ